ncbi:unnamed protein product, partial [marine sediment metagenome]
VLKGKARELPQKLLASRTPPKTLTYIHQHFLVNSNAMPSAQAFEDRDRVR